MSTTKLPSWAQPREILDLVRLALPVAASRSTFMLMSLTDSVVLARSAHGQLPYVLNAWLPLGVLLGLGMGLMLGVQVLTSELSGAGKEDETGRIFRRGLLVGTIFGILATGLCLLIAEPLFGLFGFEAHVRDGTVSVTRILAYGLLGHMASLACTMYLEALRRPNIVTAISMAAVAFNLVFDLIVVPQYGAVGVAWATTISRFLMTLLFLVPIIWLTPALKRKGEHLPHEFRRQNMVGLGTGVANMAEWGSFNLTFVIATLVSIDAATVYGLTVQFIGAIFMIYLGLGTATSVRVAESFGRKDALGIRNASRLGVVATLVIGGLLSLALYFVRYPLAEIGLDASDAESAAAHLVPLLAGTIAVGAIVSIYDGLQAVAAMALRAREIVWAPTLIHIGSFVGIMLPLSWHAALPDGWNMGVWGVMLGIAVALGVAGLGQVILLEWTLRRRSGAPPSDRSTVSAAA